MKKAIPILLALILSQPLAAQDAPFDGEWNCGLHHVDDPLNVCVAFCRDATLDWTVIPVTWTCPDSEEGIGINGPAECKALGDMTPPLCCPPGTECSREVTQPPDTGAPGTPGTSATSSSGGNDNFRNGVLLAGGIVIAGAWLYNTMQPPLPAGLTLKPYAHLDYAGGMPATSAGFRGEYGNWAFSAASVNTRGEWIRPYARVRWSWVF